MESYRYNTDPRWDHFTDGETGRSLRRFFGHIGSLLKRPILVFEPLAIMKRLRRCLDVEIRKTARPPMSVAIVGVISRKYLFSARAVFVYPVLRSIRIDGRPL